MKIIAIDAGNTHLRIAKIDTDFLGANSLQNIEIIHCDYDNVFTQIKKMQVSDSLRPKMPIAIASVVPKGKELFCALSEGIMVGGDCRPPVVFCEREAAKLKINYANTLGIDRIVDAVAGLKLFPDRDLIIIDSGTATTVDSVKVGGEFLGGFILPGIKITSEAIFEKTAALPKCNPKELRLSDMPQDTISALSSGLIIDCAGGIEYAIDLCTEKLSNPQIVACGGGWEIVKKFVRREVITIPELTLIGTACLAEPLL